MSVASKAGVLRATQIGSAAAPSLLIEVPHGADRAAHYFALAARMQGQLPAQLEHFFFVNTDVGAWQLGERIAEQYVAAHPGRSALLLQCEIPRTFVDANRVVEFGDSDSKGGMTMAIPSYMQDARDQALLRDLHAQYVQVVETAYARIVGGGGFAVIPHTFAPRSVGIERVDATIVAQLHRVWSTDLVSTWPLRPEIELLTRDAAGALYAPADAETMLLSAFTTSGFTPALNSTYTHHPATLGYRWAAAYPGRVLCFEVRRDLLVQEWTPFQEMQVDPARVERVARIFADYVATQLASYPSNG
jgi:hypothetical protein